MSIRSAPSRLFFDAWSRFYDLPPIQLAVYRPVHAAVLRQLGTSDGLRLLDVGCGTGNLTARMTSATDADLIVGCDFSRGMLQRASWKETRAAWLQGDAARLPVRSGSVDAVISTDSFHWIPHPEAAIAEFRRVLRPRGRLIVALVCTRLLLTASAIRAGSGLLGEPANWPTRAEMAKRMEGAGFRVQAQRRVLRAAGVLLPTVLTIGVAPDAEQRGPQ